MKRVELTNQESLKEIAEAMKNKEPFVVVTDDKDFDPLGYDKHSAEMWIGAAGGGVLMTIGAGALVLAFCDPEPTSKLGFLIAGGVLMTVTGGGVILTILVTRAGYSSVKRFNKETGQFEWILEPK